MHRSAMPNDLTQLTLVAVVSDPVDQMLAPLIVLMRSLRKISGQRYEAIADWDRELAIAIAMSEERSRSFSNSKSQRPTRVNSP